ncbi:MAG: hypothetical protein EPO35_10865 [Acidobacteria bacterium]|nr:MAG: hypothetical protein EPO35_10865 [Acidobacteriota bacterium]
MNMVSGDAWPNGDPFLQRQNEPSVAVSTRNPLHLLAGANDYRTVDLPGLSTGPETGDAWLGLFKSFDGGERWQSTLLPGYPQDTTPEGMYSPLKGYQAGADAVVRPGTNGLMYFSGLVFNRGQNAPSAVFMSRFIDNNNKENGDPIRYLGTTMIDRSTGTEFIDKPWMAVDIPRAGAKSCKITQTDPAPVVKAGAGKGRFRGWNERSRTKAKPQLKGPKPYTQTIPAGKIYIAYSRITTVGTDVSSRIMLASSDDCGVTWSKPQQISDPADKVNQGATIAIDPQSGALYVAWRQFGLTTTATDSIVVVRSAASGKGFDKPAKVHKFKAHRPTDKLKKMIAEHQMGDADEVSEIQPFDQGTAEDRFRTNAYPSMAIDDEGRAYVAWTERGFGAARADAVDGDARVVIASSRTGAAWTTPRAVDTGAAGVDKPGHQLMPSLAFAAGKLVVVYYDLREDISRVFGPFVDENDAVATVRKRHTIDIRAAYAAKGDVPVFGPSVQVSTYLQGSRPGASTIEQMQYNAPNLPLFKLGTVPFMGDYIDLAASPAFVQEKGTWKFNTASQVAPVFHVVWTDNRDVRPPRDGNWQNYTPVKPPAFSVFDPTQPTPECQPGQTGMRNQNIYSARLTFGLVTGSPGNSKPLDPSLSRSFVVFAQNTTTAAKSYRMTIASQPVGGKASFTQESVAGQPDPLVSVDVTVAAKSMVTRTVFIKSSDPRAQVPVDVQEISAPSMPILANGLSSRVVLNPDISNPDISNPDISNPDISNPDISNAEVYNPDISNPDISNPDISNPDISNPDISNPDISNVVVANPDISNPDISNPDISNPDISNPDISNPDISNPDISNGALTDVTWTIVNTGNTTASFNVNLFLANAAAKLGGVKTQLIVHKTYTTPIANECTLKTQTQTVLVANVPNPVFQAPGTSTPFDPTNPAVTNTTVWLEPGGTSKITLRLVDPNPADDVKIDPVRDVTPVITAEPKNTEDIGTPVLPPATAPPTPDPDDLGLAFSLAGQPSTTILTQTMAPVQAHATLNGGPAVGVQVTIAIANNPAGGHLSGTTTLLTDANGNATFTDLSIEKVGIGYRLSASASAFGALPDLSVPFDIIKATAVATVGGGGTFVYDGQPHTGTCAVQGSGTDVLTGVVLYSSGSAPVNVGEYTVTCDYSGSDFYAPASDSTTITITPATPVAVATGANVDYDGAPHPGACSVTGVDNEALAGTLSWSSGSAPVDPGTYVVTCSYAASGNYAAASDVDSIIITNPYVVTSTADNGVVGTLRYAINKANLQADANTISFAIAGAGPFTITPSTPLPAITQPVVIDGLTQTGSATFAPKVFISGALMGAQAGVTIGQAPGFEVLASNSTVRGLGIQGFPGPGVYVASGGHNANTIEDNVITGNVFGVDLVYANSTNVRRNLLSGNTASGLLMIGGVANTVQLNRIGTTADGLSAQPNTDSGITMYDGTTNAVIDSNLISGNNVRGISSQFAGALVTGLRIVGNTIGLDVNGVSAVPNRGGGIMLARTEAAIVGEPGGRNVISGNVVIDPLSANGCNMTNGGPGILVSGLSTVMPAIKSNYIGLTSDGLSARPNKFEGIVLQAKARVGGPGAGEGNQIAGNGCAATLSGTGIIIAAAASGSIVQGNTIGLSVAGVALGNAFSGISAFASAGAQIGGTNPGEGNVITGNNRGIAIYQVGANPVPTGIAIVGNQIGTNAAGTMPGNSMFGVQVSTSANTSIGGTNAGAGNLIRGNGSDGVRIDGSASGAAILSNTIESNGGLGINIVGAPGVNANDLNDADAGPNGLQNFPVLTNPSNAGPATTVDFTLDTDDVNAEHTIQVFANAVCDASGFGEGSKLVGTFARTTDGSGDASGTLTLNQQVPVGEFLTATVTDAAGNTSEFSQCRMVPSAAVITSASPANNAPGEGFIVLRGSNLPTNTAVVVSGATTQNGFVFQSPSSATAVWVRLPFGQPLGAATVQLKDAAGTVVSNAFPISVTAAPGTPVITAFFTELGQPLVDPVSAGTNIAVSADGIDTSGSMVRFTQGANVWDVAPYSATSNTAIGLAALVTVPAGPSGGPLGVSIRQGAGAFSAPVTISFAPPPPAFTAWSASGPGTVTVNDDGSVTGKPQLSYNYNLGVAGGVPYSTWTFSTTSPSTRSVSLGWDLSGLHAWFAVTVKLEVFVNHLGTETIVSTPVNAGPTNCCASPSNGFAYSGNLNVNVQAGDTYGFKVSGSNGDLNSFLQGVLKVVVDGGAAPAELLSAEAGFRAIDQRADVSEHVEGGAIVQEDRRRLAFSR